MRCSTLPSHRLQKLVSDPAGRVLRRPSVGFLCGLVPEGDDAALIPGEDHVVRQVEQARLCRETFRRRLVLKREQRRDGDGREADERAQGRRGDRVQIVRQQIGGYREHDTACRSDDDIIAPGRLRREKNRNDIEDGDGALQRREDVDEKHRKGENGRPEPQSGSAHG